MKLQRMLLLFLVLTVALTPARNSSAARAKQSYGSYQQMTLGEQSKFVAQQAREIALRMSGRNYAFTPEFTAEIQDAISDYVQRIGSEGDQRKENDTRFILERGQKVAPILITAFKRHNVSPLIGLYIPFIESEYINIQAPNSVGALGIFQFLPRTGQLYGLTPDELLDVEKSADAAARYIAENLKRFQADEMRETLALLAYNRGATSVENDLATLVAAQNRSCSICAITEQRYKSNSTLSSENVYYVPRFLAAAIIGENPQSFGLQSKPLSSFQAKP